MTPRQIQRAFALLAPSQVRLARESCPICGFSWQVRLARNEIAVRCLRCHASAVTQSLVDVLSRVLPDLSASDAYELSAEGPLVRFLEQQCRSLSVSEYFESVPSGQLHHGIVCQNVESLTYADASFDLCTSTEVFEHVEDDKAGFRELLRVLRPGGLLVFTVPLDLQNVTVERTAIRNGIRIHMLPAEYHADRYRGDKIFCYRNYGRDIIERLIEAGFSQAEIVQPERKLFGFARAVVVAHKAR